MCRVSKEEFKTIESNSKHIKSSLVALNTNYTFSRNHQLLQDVAFKVETRKFSTHRTSIYQNVDVGLI